MESYYFHKYLTIGTKYQIAATISFYLIEYHNCEEIYKKAYKEPNPNFLTIMC